MYFFALLHSPLFYTQKATAPTYRTIKGLGKFPTDLI